MLWSMKHGKRRTANNKLMFEFARAISSPYLTRIYGANLKDFNSSNPRVSIVSEFCDRGSMYHCFHFFTFVLLWRFSYSILTQQDFELDWNTCSMWINQALVRSLSFDVYFFLLHCYSLFTCYNKNGLVYMHNINMLHRDITTSNLLVSDDWSVKVL